MPSGTSCAPGGPTGGTFHFEKGQVYRNALKDWLRANEKRATTEDARWARWLNRELERAMRGD